MADIGPCLAAYGAPPLAFAKPATSGRQIRVRSTDLRSQHRPRSTATWEVAQQLGQRQLGSVPPELAEGLVMGVRGIERSLEQWEMGVKDVH